MKRILIILLAILLVGGFFGYSYYQKIFTPNMPSDLPSEYVLIPTNSTFEEVSEMLSSQGFIKNKSSFEWVANQMNYPKNPMRSGRFKVQPNMSNRALVGLLRNGEQTPVRVAIHNKWNVNQIAGLLAAYLEPDSADFAKTFLDEALLDEFGLKRETAITAFIADSYDFYWNTTAEEVFRKMIFYRDKFWSEDRLDKALSLGLSKEEVYTLASIVDAETNQSDEMARIAGLYLNRLNKGMKLESDPTAKFGLGNFALDWIKLSHLEVESPYNTYKVTGLPPGPIYLASQAAIKHTLSPEDNNYIYMCAQPGGTGYHNFAVTFVQHKANARKYHQYSREQRRKKRLEQQNK